jgi:hypothetical protein
MANQKMKDSVNERQSGVQESGRHSGRLHPQIEKARDAKLDTSAQHRALQAMPVPVKPQSSKAGPKNHSFRKYSDVPQK